VGSSSGKIARRSLRRTNESGHAEATPVDTERTSFAAKCPRSALIPGSLRQRWLCGRRWTAPRSAKF